MGIRELIEQCRRKQRQLPGQIEIPLPDDQLQLLAVYAGMTDYMQPKSLWATEEEYLEHWRSETEEYWLDLKA